MEENRRAISARIQEYFQIGQKGVVHWPFVLYVSFLALIMIYSAHSADRKVYQIHDLNFRVKELSSEFVSYRTDVMNRTRITSISPAAKKIGLVQSREGLYRIERSHD